MPDWPQSSDEWRTQIAACLGLDDEAAAQMYSTGSFPYDLLVDCLRETFGTEAGQQDAFADALVRNVRGLVGWAYGNGLEPSWPDRDPHAVEPGGRRVIRLSIAVKDLDDSRVFYEEVMGWQLGKEQECDGRRCATLAIEGGVVAHVFERAQSGPRAEPGPWIVPVIEVSTLEDVVQELGARGIDFDGPDRSPFGCLLKVQDPSGNLFEILEFDASSRPMSGGSPRPARSR